ncbi:MAG TPA: hypothetical protein VMH80_16260 [Bryobacteraceae bacterium]|nr:hypothetical protein [Bryobacteraceae bacterium]
MSTTTTDPVLRWLERREAINRANAQHSTGPRTAAGKQRSSLNALTHGLTAASPVLPPEDRAAYDRHVQQFRDEYRPATPTETQFVQELADTAWRLNRIPKLEAALLDRAANPPSEQAAIQFDIVDAHRALATLGLHGSRLSRQFQKTLATLRDLQAERAERERRSLRDAAEILVHHQHKGLSWDPANDGFVFSKQQVERHAQLLMRQNEARHTGFVRFQMAPPLVQVAGVR